MIHKAKKSLGQNFLKSTLAIKKIIEAGEISLNDIILEIGPGKGILTRQLLATTSCQLIAVEKDYNLYEILKNEFKKEILSGQLRLINDDILKFNLESYKLKAKSYKILANIPYNITGAILKKFLGEINQPEMMILMVQNEVAKRIIGETKNPSTRLRVKESILSISVKVYGDPKIIMKVPSRYFSPAPKVDSAIIAIKNISRKTFIENNINEEKFWEIIHAGFAHKRKKLASNLKTLLKNGGIASATTLKNKRAEELSLADWINIIKSIDINKKE